DDETLKHSTRFGTPRRGMARLPDGGDGIGGGDIRVTGAKPRGHDTERRLVAPTRLVLGFGQLYCVAACVLRRESVQCARSADRSLAATLAQAGDLLCAYASSPHSMIDITTLNWTDISEKPSI